MVYNVSFIFIKNIIKCKYIILHTRKTQSTFYGDILSIRLVDPHGEVVCGSTMYLHPGEDKLAVIDVVDTL